MHILTWISQYNVRINHEARQVTQEDFRKFDYILASDEANLRNLERMKPRDATATVKLFGSFDDNRPIGDPYYGGIVSLFRSLLSHILNSCIY